MLQYIGITIFALYIILFLIINWRLYKRNEIIRTRNDNTVVAKVVPASLANAHQKHVSAQAPASVTNAIQNHVSETIHNSIPETMNDHVPVTWLPGLPNPQNDSKTPYNKVSPTHRRRKRFRRKKPNGPLLQTDEIPGEQQEGDGIPGEQQEGDEIQDDQSYLLRAFNMSRRARQNREIDPNEVEMYNDDMDESIPLEEFSLTAPIPKQGIDPILQEFVNQNPELISLVSNMHDGRVSDEDKKTSILLTLEILSRKGLSTTQLNYICKQVSGMPLRRLCLDRLPYILERFSNNIDEDIRVWITNNIQNFSQIVNECERQAFGTVHTTIPPKGFAKKIDNFPILKFVIVHMLCPIGLKKQDFRSRAKESVRSMLKQLKKSVSENK